MSLDLEEEPSREGISFQELNGKRWIHGGYREEDLVPLAEDVVAFHNGTHIKMIYLKSGTNYHTYILLED